MNKPADPVDAGELRQKVMNTEADRLKTFTTHFPSEVAQMTFEQSFAVTMTNSSSRQLAEGAIAIFVSGYLSQCGLALVGQQLLINCPTMEIHNNLKMNFLSLKDNDRLASLLERAKLEEVKAICITSNGNDGTPMKGIVRVQ